MAASYIVREKGELFYPHRSVFAGEILNIELTIRKITARDICNRSGMIEAKFSRHLNGITRFTPEFALIIEKELDIPADYWLTVQMNYDLYVARNKERLEK